MTQDTKEWPLFGQEGTQAVTNPVSPPPCNCLAGYVGAEGIGFPTAQHLS
jgi:hypothetical protein